MIKKIITNNFMRVATILLLLFFANAKSNAQNENNNNNSNGDIYKNAVTFGLAHSMHFTSIVGDFPSKNLGNFETSISTSSPRFTFGIGMTVDYHFNKMLSLQFDFMYMYAGSHLIQKTKVYNEIGIVKSNKYYTYAMDYFKFPLTLNFYPVHMLYINGGGYFAPLISASKYDYWYDSREPIEDINPFDYGLVVGMGLNLKYIKLGFQYSYGIGSIVDNKNSNIHNNVFEFSARWKFYSDIRNRNNNK